MTMELLHYATLVVLIACNQLVAGMGLGQWLPSWIGTSLRDPYLSDYDQINEYLVKLVPSEDPIDNIEMAQNWLSMAIHSKPQNDKVPPMRRGPLVQFTSLVLLMDNTTMQCDYVSYDILLRNERSCGTKLMVPLHNLELPRRIEWVIWQVAQSHASRCLLEYPLLLRWAREGWSERRQALLKNFMKDIISTSDVALFMPENRSVDRRQILKDKAKGVKMTGKKEAEKILSFLRSQVPEGDRSLQVVGDETRLHRPVINMKRVRQLLNDKVFQLCREMNAKLEKVLVPAAYELQLGLYEYRANDQDSANLMIFLVYFRLCEDMLNNEQIIANNVVGKIWEEYRLRSS